MPTIIVTDGPFAGWQRWASAPSGRFVDIVGRVAFRDLPDGAVEVGVEVGRQHSNSGNALHGGYLMAFIDMALYGIAASRLAGTDAVTLSCNTEFLGAGKPEGVLTATGRVLKETGKSLFIQGVVEQAGAPVCAFSGVLRKISSSR